MTRAADSRNRLLRVGCVAALLVALAAPRAAVASDDTSSTRRFALVVANNDSVDSDVESLEYADDDGARYFEMFDSLTHHVELLTEFDTESRRLFPDAVSAASPPTSEQLDAAVQRLAKRIKAADKKGHETETYLVFTGHGNVNDSGAGYLSLANSKLRRSDLYRDVIRPLDADYTHLVIDACHAYHMVHSRGDEEEEWEDDRSGQKLDRELKAYLTKQKNQRKNARRSVGVVVSTAGTAKVHEWSRYRAGVFSHQLRSGLLGAADANGDGSVTYRELEAYLAAANASVTNPKARIDIYAHPPAKDRKRSVTDIDAFRNATTLEVPSGSGGRYHLVDARGLRYADFHVSGSQKTRVALLREPLENAKYYLGRGDKRAEISADSTSVSASDLSFEDAPNQSRGAIDEAFRSNLFGTPFGPSFVAGYQSGRRAGRSAATDSPARRDRWSLDAAAAYGVGRGLTELYRGTPATSTEHQLDVRALFRHRSGWGAGVFLGYGLWAPASGVALHRFAGGVEGSYRFRLGSFAAVPHVRAGHTGYLLAEEGLRSDPIGFRASAGLGLEWQISSDVRLFAEPSIAASAYTVDRNNAPNTEQWFIRPEARIGISF